MDLKKSSHYKNIVECYGGGGGGGGAFSIMGAMKINTGSRCLQGDDCWCMDKDKGLPPQGGCYIQCRCNDCDLNKTGFCPQDSGSDPLPGVS